MDWLASFQLKRKARAAHAFLLHLGTNDVQITKNELHELRDYLFAQEPFKDAEFVAYYNRSLGIQFATPKMEETFLRLLNALYPQEEGMLPESLLFKQRRQTLGALLKYYSALLQIGWNDPRPEVQKKLKDFFGTEHYKVKQKDGTPFFIGLVEYPESLAPPNAMASSCQDDRVLAVTFLEWGKSSAILNANNTVVFVTESIGKVTEELLSDTQGVMPIEIPFPTRTDRLHTLHLLQEELARPDLGISAELAAKASAGLTRRNLVQLVRETITAGSVLDQKRIFDRKKKHLDERSRGMIELSESPWGLQAIGALAQVKEYLQRVAHAMRERNFLAVPQGILLLGPPGCGKTVAVQALSYEIELPIGSFRNLREMWVGQSERNQDFILKLAVNYAPLIFFIDEIDQEFLTRGTVFHGDTGVSARLQKRFMEIMSDTNLRGDTLFIGASNRPEDIDQAFLREGRFDDVLIFLPTYDPADRADILRAILHKIAKQKERVGERFVHELSDSFIDDEFGWISHGHFEFNKGWSECAHHQPDQNPPDVKPYTGAEIEYIATFANRFWAEPKHRPLQEDDIRKVLRDFIPKRDMQQFERAIDAALAHCNMANFIPPEYQERARRTRGARVGGGPAGVTLSSPSSNTGQYL